MIDRDFKSGDSTSAETGRQSGGEERGGNHVARFSHNKSNFHSSMPIRDSYPPVNSRTARFISTGDSARLRAERRLIRDYVKSKIDTRGEDIKSLLFFRAN